MKRNNNCVVCGSEKVVKETLYEKNLLGVILGGGDSHEVRWVERGVTNKEDAIVPGENQWVVTEVWCGSCGVLYNPNSLPI